MNVLRRMVIGLAGVVVVALVMELAAPKAVHALVSTLVTVANTSTNPVPTVATDNPALQPFSAQVNEDSSDTGAECLGSVNVPSATSGGVPVKTVVIEEISGNVSFTGTGPAFIDVQPNGVTGIQFFLPLNTGSNTNGNVTFGQQTRLYADPGGLIVLFLGPDSALSSTTLTSCQFSVSGYLVTQ